MANITEILGTDSVSSTRPIINSNFELLNDELASVTALLNPTTLKLSGLSSISADEIAIGIDSLKINNTIGAVFNIETTFGKSISMGGSIVKSGVVGSRDIPTTQITPTSIEHGTYFVESSFTLPEATDGQEVTVINSSVNAISVLTAIGASIGASSVALDGINSTVTLRCFNNTWYVISSHNATIV